MEPRRKAPIVNFINRKPDVFELGVDHLILFCKTQLVPKVLNEIRLPIPLGEQPLLVHFRQLDVALRSDLAPSLGKILAIVVESVRVVFRHPDAVFFHAFDFVEVFVSARAFGVVEVAHDREQLVDVVDGDGTVFGFDRHFPLFRFGAFGPKTQTQEMRPVVHPALTYGPLLQPFGLGLFRLVLVVFELLLEDGALFFVGDGFGWGFVGRPGAFFDEQAQTHTFEEVRENVHRYFGRFRNFNGRLLSASIVDVQKGEYGLIYEAIFSLLI